VDEDLQRQSGGFAGGGELGQFPKGKFPRENGQVKALAAGEGDTFRGGQGHLGGGVEFDPRADRLGEANEAKVLDDEGIDLGFSGQTKQTFGLRELGGEDKDIHGEVTAAPPRVEVVHHFGEILLGKVFRPETGVEGGQAEINRIGAGGDGGLEAVPIAGGGE
jgi:hypothetical protein